MDVLSPYVSVRCHSAESPVHVLTRRRGDRGDISPLTGTAAPRKRRRCRAREQATVPEVGADRGAPFAGR